MNLRLKSYGFSKFLKLIFAIYFYLFAAIEFSWAGSRLDYSFTIQTKNLYVLSKDQFKVRKYEFKNNVKVFHYSKEAAAAIENLFLISGAKGKNYFAYFKRPKRKHYFQICDDNQELFTFADTFKKSIDDLGSVTAGLNFQNLFVAGACKEEVVDALSNGLERLFKSEINNLRRCFKVLDGIAAEPESGQDRKAQSVILSYISSLIKFSDKIKVGEKPFEIRCEIAKDGSDHLASIDERKNPPLISFSVKGSTQSAAEVSKVINGIGRKSNAAKKVIGHELFHISESHLPAGADFECVDEKYIANISSFCDLDDQDLLIKMKESTITKRVINECLGHKVKRDENLLALNNNNHSGVAGATAVLRSQSGSSPVAGGIGAATNGDQMSPGLAASGVVDGEISDKRQPSAGDKGGGGMASALASTTVQEDRSATAQQPTQIVIPAAVADRAIAQGAQQAEIMTEEVDRYDAIRKKYSLSVLDNRFADQRSNNEHPLVEQAYQRLAKTVDGAEQFFDQTVREITRSVAGVAGSGAEASAVSRTGALLAGSASLGGDLQKNLAKLAYLGDVPAAKVSPSPVRLANGASSSALASESAAAGVSSSSKIIAKAGVRQPSSMVVATVQPTAPVAAAGTVGRAAVGAKTSAVASGPIRAEKDGTEEPSSSDEPISLNSAGTRAVASIPTKAVAVKDSRALQALSIMTEMSSTSDNYKVVKRALSDPAQRVDIERRGFAIVDIKNKPIVGSLERAKVCFRDKVNGMERIKCQK